MGLNRRTLIAAGALTAASQAQAAVPAARERLLGTWSLVEALTVRNGEPSADWNGGAIARLGLLMYQPSGWMSVQIARPRQGIDSKLEFDKLSADQRLKYLDSYYGYFGRFEIDEEAFEVHHNVVSSLDPTEIGVKFRRRFKFDGDKLVLTTLNSTGPARTSHNRLIWVRA